MFDITIWDLFPYALFYLFFFSLPVAVIVLAVKFLRLRKRSKQFGTDKTRIPPNRCQRVTGLCAVLVPVVFLTGEVVELTRQINLSKLYAVPYPESSYQTSIVMRIVYAFVFCALFTLIRLDYIEKKRVTQGNKQTDNN